MADLIPCPSCQATLRIPPKAEAIRCPKCKTVVSLAKPKVLKAIPLPFDRPAASPPVSPAIPMATILPAEKPVVRGQVVREEEEQEEVERRQRKRRRDEDSIKNHPRYERTDQECKMARIGVWILAVGALFSALQALCYAGFLGGVSAGSPLAALLILPATFLLGFHSLLFLIGYGFCTVGPRGMRSTSVIGLLVTLLHSALLIPLALYGFVVVARLRGEDTNISDSDITRIVFIFSSFMSNLNCLTDFPWMFIRGDYDVSEWKYILMMIGGSLLEFAKMSVLGTLVQYYASEGKSHELGFRSLRFVYRIIWVIIAVGLLKLITLVAFIQLGGGGSANGFHIPHALFTVGYFLWWTFAWYSQYVAMREAVEVITASRFLDKRAALDDRY